MTTETAIQKTYPQAAQTSNDRPLRTFWTYRPNVDILDTPDELRLIADMPGASPDHIDVSVESGILTLQAEVTPRHHGSAPYVLHEYGVGGFHRRFEVDESIDAEAVTADYRDGTLTVRLPKTQSNRRRRIPVST